MSFSALGCSGVATYLITISSGALFSCSCFLAPCFAIQEVKDKAKHAKAKYASEVQQGKEQREKAAEAYLKPQQQRLARKAHSEHSDVSDSESASDEEPDSPPGPRPRKKKHESGSAMVATALIGLIEYMKERDKRQVEAARKST